jgi:hypothetical protein
MTMKTPSRVVAVANYPLRFYCQLHARRHKCRALFCLFIGQYLPSFPAQQDRNS